MEVEEGVRKMAAKIENDCFDSPLTTTSCAGLCCAAAKEGYYPDMSGAYRLETAFELQNSNDFGALLYRSSVRIGAGRRGFWGNREVEPKFRGTHPSAELAVRMDRHRHFGCRSEGPLREFRGTIILRYAKSLSSKNGLDMNMQRLRPVFVDRDRPVGHFPGPFRVYGQPHP
jgi:hypothetical protein